MNDAILDWTAPRRVRLTVEDFVRLEDAGAFSDYAKTELIDGEVLAVNSQHRPHAFIKTELGYRFRTALASLGSRLHPLIEPSIAIPPHDAPEPDIVLTSEPKGEGFVPLGSVALVVEVAVSTVAFDLGRKQRLYAASGIPEYWVVDVERRAIGQMWTASDGSYLESMTVAFGEPVESRTLVGLVIETDDLD